MIRLAAAALVLVAGASQDGGPPPSEIVFAQVTVRQQVIVRLPRAGGGRVEASAAPARWREARGPRCLAIRDIAGALPAAASVDFLLRDRRRVRAHLGQRCAGLDYYRGMYLNANSDGQVCAARDAIRSRMGDQCDILGFTTLQPVRP